MLRWSRQLGYGQRAASFALPDTDGNIRTLDDYAASPALLVGFICNHCPYVIHVNPEIVRMANDYLPKGVGFVAISSNDAEKYPDDGPDKMATHAQAVGYTFPYLYDESQDVAKAYDAACTPDFYVFDGRQRLYYRGRLDGARPKNDLRG